MLIPDYVPSSIRTHAAHFIQRFNSQEIGCKVKIHRIDENLNDPLYLQQHSAEVDCLRKERADAVIFRNNLVGDIETIKRLISDKRMEDVFSLLTKEFASDEKEVQLQKLENFFHAAWASVVEYKRYRETIERVTELNKKMAKSAKELSSLLKSLIGSGVNCPSEFYNLPCILRKSESHLNKDKWKEMRPTLLGEESFKTQESDAMQKHLRYAWEKAPVLDELLDTLVNEANHFKPMEFGSIGAAISSRKRNPRTEYIRAFYNLLTEEHNFSLTIGIYNAMAITATVVINDENVVISYNDVKSACTR